MDRIIKRLVHNLLLAFFLGYLLYLTWNMFAPRLGLPSLSHEQAFAVILLILILS